MKPYLLIISYAIILFGCNSDNINDKSKRNQNWAWWVDAKTGKSKWIPLADETTVDKGRFTCFYFNGNVFLKGKLDNGKRVDTIYRYDTSGQLEEYGFCEADSIRWYFIKDGHHTTYDADGKISTDGIVQNHTNGDKWTLYYTNGNLKQVDNFIDGAGWYVHYYENGHLKDSSYCVKGDGDYVIKSWYENGQVEYNNGWKNNVLNGICTYYYKNGLMKDSLYMVNGLKDGATKEWYENGKIKIIDNYKMGMNNGLQSVYYENGNLKTEGSMVNGVLTGEVKNYNEDGKLIKINYFKDNHLINSVSY